jgi:hypothetical protein
MAAAKREVNPNRMMIGLTVTKLRLQLGFYMGRRQVQVGFLVLPACVAVKKRTEDP